MIISSSGLGNGHAVEDGWRGDELNLGILLLEGLEESWEAVLFVIIEASSATSQPILIANLDVSNLPGACVAEDGGADTAPVCGSVASKKFHLVQSTLYGLIDAGFG